MQEEQFNLLPLNEKVAYTDLNGIYQTYRTLGDFVVKLYQINDFYVEIYFNNRIKKVGWVQSFKSDRYLEPYFELAISGK